MSHLVDGFNLCPYPHLYLWWLPLEAPKTENTRMTTVHHIRSQFVFLLSDGVLSESKASETWRETQRCSESLVDFQCSPQTLQTRSLVFPPPPQNQQGPSKSLNVIHGLDLHSRSEDFCKLSGAKNQIQ